MRSTKKHKRGFTLLELLVTLGIFVIMTTLLLSNQRRFNNTLDLTNLAYDLSLTIRQAQTYGYSVKAQGTTGTTKDFQHYFGVHFDMNYKNSFVVFADSTSNGLAGRYDPTIDVAVTTYRLKNNFTFDALCAMDNGEQCYSASPHTLDITFKRPNPDAIIGFFTSASGNPTPANHVRIKIKSTDGKYKAVDVYRSGQISVVDIQS